MENTRVFSLLIIWFNLSDTMVQLLAHTRHSNRAEPTKVFVAERVHGIVRLDELFAVVV